MVGEAPTEVVRLQQQLHAGNQITRAQRAQIADLRVERDAALWQAATATEAARIGAVTRSWLAGEHRKLQGIRAVIEAELVAIGIVAFVIIMVVTSDSWGAR